MALQIGSTHLPVPSIFNQKETYGPSVLRRECRIMPLNAWVPGLEPLSTDDHFIRQKKRRRLVTKPHGKHSSFQPSRNDLHSCSTFQVSQFYIDPPFVHRIKVQLRSSLDSFPTGLGSQTTFICLRLCFVVLTGIYHWTYVYHFFQGLYPQMEELASRPALPTFYL